MWPIQRIPQNKRRYCGIQTKWRPFWNSRWLTCVYHFGWHQWVASTRKHEYIYHFGEFRCSKTQLMLKIAFSKKMITVKIMATRAPLTPVYGIINWFYVQRRYANSVKTLPSDSGYISSYSTKHKIVIPPKKYKIWRKWRPFWKPRWPTELVHSC